MDNCASGGGRLDLWSLRYSVPINRCDADKTSIPLRLSLTESLSKWVPFNGAESAERKSELDPVCTHSNYSFRASYLPFIRLTAQFSTLSREHAEVIRRGNAEWREINKYLLKDFYTLTPWHDHLTDDTIDALEYFDPEEKSGILLIFRQAKATADSVCLSVKGLEPDAVYVVQDADSGKEEILTGRELANYRVSLPEQRMALLKKIQMRRK